MTLSECKKKIKNKIDSYKGRLKSAEDKPFIEGKIAGMTEALGLLGQYTYWCDSEPKENGKYILKGSMDGDVRYTIGYWDNDGFDIYSEPDIEDCDGWHKIEE